METLIANPWIVIAVIVVLAAIYFMYRQRKNIVPAPLQASPEYRNTMSDRKGISNRAALDHSKTKRYRDLDDEDDFVGDIAEGVLSAAALAVASPDTLGGEITQENLNESGREKTGLEISDKESARVASPEPARDTYSPPVDNTPSYSSSYDSGSSSDSGGGGGDD